MMFKVFLLLGCLCLSTFCFASGYVPSELSEVIDDFENIFIVKITSVQIEQKKTKSKGFLTQINVDFLTQEVLKGQKKNRGKAKYILPPCSFKDEDGKHLGLWLKVKGSGQETLIKKGKEYIIYFPKQRFISEDNSYKFERIDSVDKRDEVRKLIRERK